MAKKVAYSELNLSLWLIELNWFLGPGRICGEGKYFKNSKKGLYNVYNCEHSKSYFLTY